MTFHVVFPFRRRPAALSYHHLKWGTARVRSGRSYAHATRSYDDTFLHSDVDLIADLVTSRTPLASDGGDHHRSNDSSATTELNEAAHAGLHTTWDPRRATRRQFHPQVL